MGWWTEIKKAVGWQDKARLRAERLAAQKAQRNAYVRAHCEVLLDHGEPVPIKTATGCREVGVPIPTERVTYVEIQLDPDAPELATPPSKPESVVFRTIKTVGLIASVVGTGLVIKDVMDRRRGKK